MQDTELEITITVTPRMLEHLDKGGVWGIEIDGRACQLQKIDTAKEIEDELNEGVALFKEEKQDGKPMLCPECKAHLARAGTGWYCPSCGKEVYPQKGK